MEQYTGFASFKKMSRKINTSTMCRPRASPQPPNPRCRTPVYAANWVLLPERGHPVWEPVRETTWVVIVPLSLALRSCRWGQVPPARGRLKGCKFFFLLFVLAKKTNLSGGELLIGKRMGQLHTTRTRWGWKEEWRKQRREGGGGGGVVRKARFPWPATERWKR